MNISNKDIAKAVYQKLLRWFLTKQHFILAIILLWIIFEYLYKHHGIDFIVLLVGLPFGFILEVIVSFAPKLTQKRRSKKRSKKSKAANSNDSKGLQRTLDNTYALLTLKPGWFNLQGLVSLLFATTLLLGIPAIMAHGQVCGRVISFFSSMQYTDIATEMSIPSEPAVTSPPKVTHPLGSDQLDYTDKPSTITPETPTFLTDPNRYFQLSSEEYDKLYFLSGPYAITDWTDSVEISQTLALYLSELHAQNCLNSFDTNAPESLQNEVAFASELEICMTNSDDLDQIIDIRINAWSQYPKHSLAKLLASNQQQYALEYEKVNGAFETIEYYYAHSTFWLFESLSFSDVGEYTTKTILASIKMRYNDIASIAPANSHSKYYATILFEAFESLENSYV